MTKYQVIGGLVVFLVTAVVARELFVGSKKPIALATAAIGLYGLYLWALR